MSKLVLHRGGVEVEYLALRELTLPEATPSHVPIEHWRVVDLVKHSLTYYGHEIIEEHHAVAEEGMRYFGLLTLRSPYGNYTDTLGLRNSNDKSFPVGIAFGSRTFVCDNLAFIGDHTIRRKHTQRLKFELPGLIANIVEPLADRRQEQAQTFERYQATPLLPWQADHAIMQLFRDGVIGVQRIADVHQQWEEPAYDWGDKTAYRLFNATTYALTGRVAENPTLTRKLHRVIDGTCEAVA
jgi:hypothetical protein